MQCPFSHRPIPLVRRSDLQVCETSLRGETHFLVKVPLALVYVQLPLLQYHVLDALNSCWEVWQSQVKRVTAARIQAGDFESWHAEWIKPARRAHTWADEAFGRGQRVSAREAYLQVIAANTPAIALYQTLGFTEAYRYHYRIQDRIGPKSS